MEDTSDIKAMTMVRNDKFLPRWVKYYGAQLGEENLYIFFDGEDQEIPEFCKNCHTLKIPKIQGNVVDNDHYRSRFLSEQAARLFEQGADMVIATDADEFLIVDPSIGLGLNEFLTIQKPYPCMSGLGVDVMPRLSEEKEAIDFDDIDTPILSKREFGRLYARYTKPSVITRPLKWGGGFHRVKGKNFHLIQNLYLFHLGAADVGQLTEISNDPARIAGGWGRHQEKRQRAVEKFNKAKILPWQPTCDRVRTLQKFCRPIFALNKPSTMGLRFVVRIKDGFRNLV